MKHNKLVRDKIPEIIKKNGDEAVTHIADEKEYVEALMRKLGEEVDEFLKDPSAEEAADILEVLRAICDLNGVTVDAIEEIRQQKAEERGAFKNRIILEKTEY